MSYKIMKTVISLLTGILLIAAYAIYTFGKVRAGALSSDDLRPWAATILVFIGIGVVASIVIQIVFHILFSVSVAVKEQVTTGQCTDRQIEKTLELDMLEDEMDKLIELKAMRVGFAIVGFGFAAALGSLMLAYSPAVMLNIMFAAFYLGSLIEGITQIYYYRAGIRN